MTSRAPVADKNPFFVAGGTLRSDAPSYVERKADRELLTALLDREFCYVLTSRQMGKSSLIVRTSARLEAAGARVAVLDLTALGQNLSVEQWYGGLLFQLGQRLALDDELMDFWAGRRDLGPLQRWFLAIQNVVFPRITAPLVIFIDEIDVVRSLPFRTDEFFAGIRECYTRRATDADFERLTFCLSGVVTPSDLIQDERTTPFNIGRRIELTDFDETEARPLAAGLPTDAAEANRLLDEILSWTGGHPYLTQRFCQTLSERFPTTSEIRVGNLCEELFLSPAARANDSNLAFVRDRLLKDGGDLTELLELYRKVRKGVVVPAESQSPLLETLRLSGIVRIADGRLRVSNRIYERVFDPKWIDFNLPIDELTRQRRAFRSGVLRASFVSALIIGVIGILGGITWDQWQRAEREAERNRQLVYANKLDLARLEYENANTERSQELLDELTPRDGNSDTREMECWILKRLTQSQELAFPVNRQVYSARLEPDGKSLIVGLVDRSIQQETAAYHIQRIQLDRDGSHAVLPLFKTIAGKNFNLIAFSPDGRFVATDDEAGTVTVRNVRDGRESATFGSEKINENDRRLTAIAFSPDGQKLLTCDFGKSLVCRKFPEGNVLWRNELKENFTQRVAFSKDGKWVAVPDESPVLQLFDTLTGKPIREFHHAKLKFTNACFSPDGRRLLAAAEEGPIPAFDVQTGRVDFTLTGHAAPTAAIAFSPDGRIIATGNADRTIKLWDPETGYVIETIRGHGGDVRTLNWSPDGRRLISGSVDTTVKVWNIDDILRQARPFPNVTSFLATVIVPDGFHLGFGISDEKQPVLVRFDEGGKTTVAPLEKSPGGKDGNRFLCAAFSADGRFLAAGGTDSIIRMWETTTGKAISQLKGHDGNVYNVQFSPDGRFLVSGGFDFSIRLWEVSTGKEVRRFEDPERVPNYYRAVFSPDGTILASAAKDGSVKLWEVSTGNLIRTLTGHKNRVRGIAFSPDGTRLATGGQDHTLRLWDVRTGKELTDPKKTEQIHRLAFSPNGTRIVTGSLNGEIVLWNSSESLQEVVRLKNHVGEISGIVFSPDGKRMAVCSTEGRLLRWETGNPER
jgi:WD40 repeat protein